MATKVTARRKASLAKKVKKRQARMAGDLKPLFRRKQKMRLKKLAKKRIRG